MTVPPHPHCGLATVSWLFRGEIEHRDSLGTHELVLPGELNLMTAGRGIAHSEVSTPSTTILHGVLVDSGGVEIDGMPAAPGVLVALPLGTERLRLRAGDAGARVLLIGGTPMDGDLVMWWNFVGGSHEEIAEARATWQAEIGAEASPAGAPTDGNRFGTVLGYPGAALPAPHLPGGRLKPRHR
jgi:redox-sensitive bicupin YhaK (pirin superfamily)